MSSSNPFPEGLELYKRSQKDCNSQREWVIQNTVSCRHNRIHACSNRDCDSMHITCTDPIQMGDYCWDGEVDTWSHSQPRSYLQLMTICKENITFSKRVSLGIRLHFLFWKVSLQFTFSFLIGPFAIIVFNFWIKIILQIIVYWQNNSCQKFSSILLTLLFPLKCSGSLISYNSICNSCYYFLRFCDFIQKAIA